MILIQFFLTNYGQIDTTGFQIQQFSEELQGIESVNVKQGK